MATKKKTLLRSTPKMSKDRDLDKFAAGAGKKGSKAEEVYPWEYPRVRDDRKKPYRSG